MRRSPKRSKKENYFRNDAQGNVIKYFRNINKGRNTRIYWNPLINCGRYRFLLTRKVRARIHLLGYYRLQSIMDIGIKGCYS
jgi:hypothetical protein